MIIDKLDYSIEKKFYSIKNCFIYYLIMKNLFYKIYFQKILDKNYNNLFYPSIYNFPQKIALLFIDLLCRFKKLSFYL